MMSRRTLCVLCFWVAAVATQAVGGPVVGVYFRGMGDNDPETGVTMLRDRLRGLLGGSHHEPYPYNVNLQDPEDFIYSFGPDRWVILAGYSAGGSAVTALSLNMWFNDLMTYEDDAVVTLDPVMGYGGSRTLAPGPDRGINLYQENGPWWIPVCTHIEYMENVNVGAGSDLVHGTIHKDPRVLNRAASYVFNLRHGRADSQARWESAAPTGDWGTAGNWGTGGAPSQYSVVTLANTSLPAGQEVVIRADATVNAVEVMGAAGVMRAVVEAGATLTATVGVAVAGNGAVELQGGTIAVLSLDLANGLLRGTGTVDGNLRNAGLLAPGGSTGVMVVTGDYRQDPAGALQIELGGLTPGDEYDRLACSGTVTLDGALDVVLVAGFLPAPGDRFAVVTCGARTGQFAAATGLDHVGGYAGLELRLGYHTAGATLTAWAMGGDADLDARVDVFDLAVLANNYATGSGKVWQDADFTGDGLVDVFDLAILGNHYGYDGTGQPIPEPATLTLLAIGGLALIRRRR